MGKKMLAVVTSKRYDELEAVLYTGELIIPNPDDPDNPIQVTAVGDDELRFTSAISEEEIDVDERALRKEYGLLTTVVEDPRFIQLYVKRQIWELTQESPEEVEERFNDVFYDLQQRFGAGAWAAIFGYGVRVDEELMS